MIRCVKCPEQCLADYLQDRSPRNVTPTFYQTTEDLLHKTFHYLVLGAPRALGRYISWLLSVSQGQKSGLEIVSKPES